MGNSKLGIYDTYLKQKIFDYCMKYFNIYLKKQKAEDEKLTDEDVKIVYDQIEFILSMIKETYEKYEDSSKADDVIIDKLIGMCTITKMNEVRLCKVLNERMES